MDHIHELINNTAVIQTFYPRFLSCKKLTTIDVLYVFTKDESLLSVFSSHFQSELNDYFRPLFGNINDFYIALNILSICLLPGCTNSPHCGRKHASKLWRGKCRYSLTLHLHLHIYPKRLTVHSGYTHFCHYMCSLGIEPTTFALLTQCSTTEPQEHLYLSIHPSIHPSSHSLSLSLSFSVSLSLSLSLSLCLSVYLSINHPSNSISLSPSIHPSIRPSVLSLSIYQSINPSIHLALSLSLSLSMSVCLSIYPFIHPPIPLSIHPSIHLSVHLSIRTIIVYFVIYRLYHFSCLNYIWLYPLFAGCPGYYCGEGTFSWDDMYIRRVFIRKVAIEMLKCNSVKYRVQSNQKVVNKSTLTLIIFLQVYSILMLQLFSTVAVIALFTFWWVTDSWYITNKWQCLISELHCRSKVWGSKIRNHKCFLSSISIY